MVEPMRQSPQAKKRIDLLKKGIIDKEDVNLFGNPSLIDIGLDKNEAKKRVKAILEHGED